MVSKLFGRWQDALTDFWLRCAGLARRFAGAWELVGEREVSNMILASSEAFTVGTYLVNKTLAAPSTCRRQATRRVPIAGMNYAACITAIFLVGGSFASAQIEPDRPGDREVRVDLTGETAPTGEDSEHLSRKYDLNQVGNRGVGGGFNVYSRKREEGLGRQLAVAVDRTVRELRDPGTVKYLSELCQSLSRHSDSRFPVTVKVIESDEPNIFALPGGILYVTTGLVSTVNNEAELAGLMSHEIAHIAARHATKGASRRTLWKFASTPAMFLGPFGILARQIGGIAVPMKLSRTAELEADLLGLQYMYLAGFDPSEFLRFLDRAYPLEDRSPSRAAQMFSQYPSLQQRLRRDQFVISSFPPRVEYVVDTSEFAYVKAKFTSPGPELRRRNKDSSSPRLRRCMHQNCFSGFGKNCDVAHE